MLRALLAQEPAPQPQASPFSNPMFLMLGLFFLFWVVVILPMSRRQRKAQEQLLSSISRGSKILTKSGIVGTVVTIKDGEDELVIRSEDTKLRIKRAAIEQVLGTDAAEAAAK
jgi:preprotein translocase subunit YajC